jgi:hypothetical protein
MSPVKTDGCSTDFAPDLPVAPAGFLPPAALSRAMLTQVECVASIWPAFADLRAAASTSKPSRLRLVVSAMVCETRLVFAASYLVARGAGRRLGVNPRQDAPLAHSPGARSTTGSSPCSPTAALRSVTNGGGLSLSCSTSTPSSPWWRPPHRGLRLRVLSPLCPSHVTSSHGQTSPCSSRPL